jgi:hypothetical protein
MRISLRAACLLTALLLPATLPAADIKGSVIWDGKMPASKAIDPPADAMCPAGLTSDAFQVDAKTKGIRHVIVSLAAVKGMKLPVAPPSPKEQVIIDQPKCLFEPRVVAIREG